MESAIVGKEKVRMSLDGMMQVVKGTVCWHCGLSEEELFWKIIVAGEEYLKGRTRTDEDFVKLRSNKGFWHWYVQVWCIAARWLIQQNDWQFLDASISVDTYKTLWRRKNYIHFDRYLRAKTEVYGFEPVLMAMHHEKEYDGRVLW